MDDSRALLERIVGIIARRKVTNVQVLEVRDLVGYTDYFVICSGQSERQVQAVAEHLITELKKDRVLPLGVEGRTPGGDWVLVDYNDVVVHIFDEATRDFYDLENLWREAPRVSVTPEPAAAAAT